MHALDGIRVIDLTADLGSYCGKLFADLGADVILVEPPGGSDQRNKSPIVTGDDGNTVSLDFEFKNANKRSVTIDLQSASGRQALVGLVRQADIVLEDAAPGHLDALGLGFDALRAANPHLVLVSMTAYGQTGPRALDPHTDLTCLAAGGLLWLGGYPDAAPMQAAGEQAYLSASVFGALSAMALLADCEAPKATHVDVSAQECVVMALENAAQYYDLERVVRTRSGASQRRAGTGVFRCADGFVMLIAGGVGGNRFWAGLLEWLRGEGVDGVDELDGEQWGNATFVETDMARETFARVFGSFTARRSMQEIYLGAQAHRVPCTPVAGPPAIFADPQLASRDFFVDVTVGGRQIPMPRPPFVLSKTPARLPHAAPELSDIAVDVDAVLGSGTRYELSGDVASGGH